MAAANILERSADAWSRDAGLMERVADGDDRAFSVLHGEHYAAVLRLAVATVLDREEARDITQEVFVRLHRIASRWEPRARVRTWLHRTTLNVALGTQRKLLRWLRPRGPSGPSQRDPERRVLAGEAVDQVRVALSVLSPRQRAVVTLHLDQGLAPRAVAEHLNITPNAARVNLHKGLHRLRGALGGAPVPGKEPS